MARECPDVEIWHIYVEEPHPGERRFKKYTRHRDYQQRLDYARELRGTLGISSPIVLDGLDGAVHHRYGYMPNMVYLVDKAGEVVYKANWTDAGAVAEVLTQLGAEDRTEVGS